MFVPISQVLGGRQRHQSVNTHIHANKIEHRSHSIAIYRNCLKCVDTMWFSVVLIEMNDYNSAFHLIPYGSCVDHCDFFLLWFLLHKNCLHQHSQQFLVVWRKWKRERGKKLFIKYAGCLYRSIQLPGNELSESTKQSWESMIVCDIFFSLLFADFLSTSFMYESTI